MDIQCVEKLYQLLSKRKVNNINYEYILHMDDFNFKEINCEIYTSLSNCEHLATKCIDRVMDTFLIQHVVKPTRNRGDNVPSILDLIFSNEKEMIADIEHYSPLGNSDHETLKFKSVYNIQINEDKKT